MSSAEPEATPNPSRVFDFPTLLFLGAALLFLYPFFFTPSFIPINQGICDSVYVSDAKRMYDGELIYRDFFQFSPPATALAYFFPFKLLGLGLWVVNAEMALVGLGLAWIGVTIAKKVTHPNLAILPSAIFLAGLYVRHIEPTHHWFSLLAACGSIAVLMERRTPARIAAAGFLGALSTCFTQTRGLAVTLALAGFLWWESRRKREDLRALIIKEAWLVASFLVALIAVNGYFIWKAGLARFFWCTVVFGVNYYPKDAEYNTFKAFFNGVPSLTDLHSFISPYFCEWLFLNGLIPATCILFFIRYWRKSGKEPSAKWERPMLLALTCTAMLLSVAPAPTFLRLAASAFPGILLLVWFIDSPGWLARGLRVLLPLGVLVVALHSVAGVESQQKWMLNTRQGQLALENGEDYEVFSWVRSHTQPLEYFYDTADAGWVGEFCLDLRNPSPISIVENNGYTTPEQVREIIQGLDRHHVLYICWSPDELDVIPRHVSLFEDHIGPLRDYIYNHYRVVKVFTDDKQIWERKD